MGEERDAEIMDVAMAEQEQEEVPPVTAAPSSAASLGTLSCRRCGYTTTNKSNLIKHLNNKTPCEATLECVAREELISELRSRKYSVDDARCEVCMKQFKSTCSMRRHMRLMHTARAQQQTPEHSTALAAVDELVKKNEELTEVVERLKHDLDELKKGRTVVNNYNVVTGNTINNNTNNIQLNAFGKENVDYITNQPNYANFMRACIKNRADGVCNFLVRKHFHEEHPENHNVRKKVKKDAFINVYDGKQWRPKLVNEALEQLFAGIEKQFAEFADMVTEKNEINKAWLDRFMQEVGIPLEWDFSSEHYEYEHDMPQAQKDAFKKDLFKLALEYICQYSKQQGTVSKV